MFQIIISDHDSNVIAIGSQIFMHEKYTTKIDCVTFVQKGRTFFAIDQNANEYQLNECIVALASPLINEYTRAKIIELLDECDATAHANEYMMQLNDMLRYA